jgi:hypothetical protein
MATLKQELIGLWKKAATADVIVLKNRTQSTKSRLRKIIALYRSDNSCFLYGAVAAGELSIQTKNMTDSRQEEVEILFTFFLAQKSKLKLLKFKIL